MEDKKDNKPIPVNNAPVTENRNQIAPTNRYIRRLRYRIST
jgi:hypothetical protein